jgi:hypothetical protein
MTASRISSPLFFVVAFAAIGFAGACSSSTASGAPDGGYNFGDVMPRDVRVLPDVGTITHDSGHSMNQDSGTPHDAGAHLDAGTCGSLPLSGAIIAPTSMPGNLPTPVGGIIATGTYVLVESDYYPSAEAPDGGTNQFVQRSLAFTATTLTISEADAPSQAGPAGPISTTTYSYQPFPPALSYMETCPFATPYTAQTQDFSVVTADGGDTQLWLFSDDGFSIDIYVMQ